MQVADQLDERLTREARIAQLRGQAQGCSIGDHVMLSQVEHAKRLLGTDQTIKVIAYSLGFSSPSSFAFAFRRATGETPREFRQRASRAA